MTDLFAATQAFAKEQEKLFLSHQMPMITDLSLDNGALVHLSFVLLGLVLLDSIVAGENFRFNFALLTLDVLRLRAQALKGGDK